MILQFFRHSQGEYLYIPKNKALTIEYTALLKRKTFSQLLNYEQCILEHKNNIA